jgi:hypothetical protein
MNAIELRISRFYITKSLGGNRVILGVARGSHTFGGGRRRIPFLRRFEYERYSESVP